MDLAIAEGIGPFLGRLLRLGRVATERLEDAERLRRQADAAVAAEMVRSDLLSEVGEALAAAGIRFLWLKGVALQRLCYPPGGRSMTDVDLLVDSADFAGALAVAGRLGFRPRPGAPRTHWGAAGHEQEIERGDQVLDLHRALAEWPLCAAEAAELFGNAETTAGGPGVPAPIDLAFGLAIDQARQAARPRLRALLDACLLLPAIADPSEFVARAARWKARRVAALWLASVDEAQPLPLRWRQAAVDLSGGKEPPALLAEIAPPPPGPYPRSLARSPALVFRLVDEAWRAAAFLASQAALGALSWSDTRRRSLAAASPQSHRRLADRGAEGLGAAGGEPRPPESPG